MKNLMQRIRNRQGFTLVELMIVVAIIGILAAIAIPAFLRAVKKSKTSEAEGNVKKMVDGAKTYFTTEQKYSVALANGGVEPWHDPAAPGRHRISCPLARVCLPWWRPEVTGINTDAVGLAPEVHDRRWRQWR